MSPKPLPKPLWRCVSQEDAATGQGDPAAVRAVLVQPRPKLLRPDSDLASRSVSLFTKEDPVGHSGCKHGIWSLPVCQGSMPDTTTLNCVTLGKLPHYLKPQCSHLENGRAQQNLPGERGEERQRSYFSWFCKKSWTSWLEKEMNNLLQCSCLENCRDRGAW